MQKNLLIVFAKNKELGKVKTRLAKTIGDEAAFQVYEKLYHITEKASCAVRNATVQVYYSNEIDPNAWVNCEQFVQQGADLGARLKTAFEAGFASGYQRIIGIGADLPEITAAVIENAFQSLENHDFVFGPADDGGYYLVGVNGDSGLYIFDDKPWSTEGLLDLTKAEIESKQDTVSLLEYMNDIDTVDDLAKSSLAREFTALIDRVKP